MARQDRGRARLKRDGMNRAARGQHGKGGEHGAVSGAMAKPTAAATVDRIPIVLDLMVGSKTTEAHAWVVQGFHQKPGRGFGFGGGKESIKVRGASRGRPKNAWGCSRAVGDKTGH